MGFFRSWPLQYEPIRPDRVFLCPSERGKIRKYLIITFGKRWKAEKFVFEVVPVNICGQEISTPWNYTWRFQNLISVPLWKILFSLLVFLLGRSPSQILKSQDVSEFSNIYCNYWVLSHLKWNLFCEHLWSLMYQGDKF